MFGERHRWDKAVPVSEESGNVLPSRGSGVQKAGLLGSQHPLAGGRGRGQAARPWDQEVERRVGELRVPEGTQRGGCSDEGGVATGMPRSGGISASAGYRTLKALLWSRLVALKAYFCVALISWLPNFVYIHSVNKCINCNRSPAFSSWAWV